MMEAKFSEKMQLHEDTSLTLEKEMRMIHESESLKRQQSLVRHKQDLNSGSPDA